MSAMDILNALRRWNCELRGQDTWEVFTGLGIETDAYLKSIKVKKWCLYFGSIPIFCKLKGLKFERAEVQTLQAEIVKFY